MIHYYMVPSNAFIWIFLLLILVGFAVFFLGLVCGESDANKEIKKNKDVESTAQALASYLNALANKGE